MKKNSYRLVFITIQAIFFLVLNTFSGRAQESVNTNQSARVYELELNQDIDASAWRNVNQAFLRAEQAGADLLLVKMNTFGGAVNFADSIRRLFLESPVKTLVYIDHNAASAGALISLASDKIYMAEGGSIGAASVVNQTGEVMPEKYQSYMRGLMRATAEAKGRDPKIAEAFVDPDVSLPELKAEGKILTLTSREALEIGLINGIAKNVQDVLSQEKLAQAEIIRHQVTFMDSLLGFFTSPAVQGFLIVLIMGGIYFELNSPGIGFPIVVAILAAVLYFAPLYLEGLAAHWEILLFIIGVVLLLLEIFVIPGFGIAGITGIAALICSFAFSMVSNDGFDFTLTSRNNLIQSFMLVILSIAAALIVGLIFGKSFIQSRVFRRLVLKDEQKADSGYVSSVMDHSLLHQVGVAQTDLRPSGKVEIGDVWYDAVALNGYIEKGSKVYVVKHESYNLFVKLKSDDSQ